MATSLATRSGPSLSRMAFLTEKLEKANLRAAASNLRAKAQEKAGIFVDAGATAAGGFAAGWASSYFDNGEIFGAPAEIGIALIGHGAGFLVGGKYAEHMHSFGNGGLAAWAANKGREAGASFVARGATSGAPSRGSAGMAQSEWEAAFGQ